MENVVQLAVLEPHFCLYTSLPFLESQVCISHKREVSYICLETVKCNGRNCVLRKIQPAGHSYRKVYSAERSGRKKGLGSGVDVHMTFVFMNVEMIDS